MRIDGRFLNWGVFFVLLGAIPLLVQANVVDRDIAARSWQLWPLLIIGAGVGLLLRASRFEMAGGLIAAATLGLMLGGLLAVGTDLGGLGRACGSDSGKTFPAQQGTLSSGEVDIEFNCGDLTIGTAQGNGWSLAGTTDDGEIPRLDAAPTRLQVRSRENVGFFGFGSHQAWTLTLPQDPTLDVDVQVNAGSGTLRFAGAHLGMLTVQGNAGSTKVDLTEAAAIQRIGLDINAGSARVALPNATLTGELQANAGSLAICVGEVAGLRITTNDNITASNNFAAQGLTKSGNTWESPNFAAATNRITLTMSANAGSLTLNPKEGCQ